MFSTFSLSAVERQEATLGPIKTPSKPTTTPRPKTTPKQIKINNSGGSCSHCSIPSTTKPPLRSPERPVGRPPPQSATGALPPGSPRPQPGRPQSAQPGRPQSPQPGRPQSPQPQRPSQPQTPRPQKPGPSTRRPPRTAKQPGSKSPPSRPSSSPPRPGQQPARKPEISTPGKPDRNRTYDDDERLYKFNYTVGFHGHHETGYRDGAKVGDYFWNGRDGRGQRVVYDANEFGYQPNITFVNLSPEETPREETEKEFGLKGYEFKWFYPLPEDNHVN